MCRFINNVNKNIDENNIPNICRKKKKKSVQTGRHHQFCFQIKLQQMIREHLLE